MSYRGPAVRQTDGCDHSGSNADGMELVFPDLLLPTTVPQSLLGMRIGPAAWTGTTEDGVWGWKPFLFLMELDAPGRAFPPLMTYSGLSGKSCW